MKADELHRLASKNNSCENCKHWDVMGSCHKLRQVLEIRLSSPFGSSIVDIIKTHQDFSCSEHEVPEYLRIWREGMPT